MIDRIEETLRRMAQTDSSSPVRQAASSALDRILAKRSAGTLLQTLKKGPLGERMRIVLSAEEIGGREAISLLLAALSDSEAEVRGAAARALGSFPSVPVLRALAERLPKEQGVVLGNLVESLGKSRRKELAPVIGRYLEHSDPFVCAKAVQAYALLADKEEWEKILALAGSENETVRAAAAGALSEWSAEEPPAG